MCPVCARKPKKCALLLGGFKSIKKLFKTIYNQGAEYCLQCYRMEQRKISGFGIVWGGDRMWANREGCVSFGGMDMMEQENEYREWRQEHLHNSKIQL